MTNVVLNSDDKLLSHKWKVIVAGEIMWRRNAMRDFDPGVYFIIDDWPWLLLSSVPEKKIPKRAGGGGLGNRLKLRKLSVEEEIVHSIMTS